MGKGGGREDKERGEKKRKETGSEKQHYLSAPLFEKALLGSRKRSKSLRIEFEK